ncbi:hypothetical protein B0H12DRAFT_1099243 [Mycena haematopus]|nr:hypothetical protein B0H12DRAFT_1099243 [Mycena haematopus]
MFVFPQWWILKAICILLLEDCFGTRHFGSTTNSEALSRLSKALEGLGGIEHLQL